MLITFDPYYTITSYNNFLQAAKDNKLQFTEYISTITPYYWYIDVPEKYLPVFVKYKKCSKAEERWLVAKLVPLFANEEFNLKRRETDKLANFEKFTTPKVFRTLRHKDYACVFRYKREQDLLEISRESGIKIWTVGEAKGWKLALCFSKYIKNYIPLDFIILEKKSKEEFSKPGEFEVELNYKKFVNDKLKNKYVEYPYYEDGKYYPLSMPSKIKQK